MAYSKVPDSQTYASQHPAHKEAGEITFTKPVFFTQPISFGSSETVEADGSQHSDATPIPLASSVIVTDGNGSKGVILPVSAAGVTIPVYPSAAGDVKVYPPSGGTINGGSANAAVTIEARYLAIFTCLGGSDWAALYIAGS